MIAEELKKKSAENDFSTLIKNVVCINWMNQKDKVFCAYQVELGCALLHSKPYPDHELLFASHLKE